MSPSRNEKWGYLNEKGTEVIAPRFNGARDFAPNGLARAQAGDA
ncbi:MAG: WG repeat-containing protein [Zoogloeaceae bacterium]|nr:WG repeat-containing protein [Zoogloeaceae bacterium]